jgi:hypothetical protein
MADDYTNLSKNDFDAIVTGELTHFCLWMEEEINAFILDYFLKGSSRKEHFKEVFFERECLTFQDKIDLIKATLNLYGTPEQRSTGKKMMKQVEDFKRVRNAFAHGKEHHNSKELKIQIVLLNRSGNKQTHEVTPESHSKFIDSAYSFLEELRKWNKEFKEHKRTLKNIKPL